MEIYIVSQRKVNILDPVFPQLYFIYENLYIIMEIHIVNQRKVNILDPVFPQLYFSISYQNKVTYQRRSIEII